MCSLCLILQLHVNPDSQLEDDICTGDKLAAVFHLLIDHNIEKSGFSSLLHSSASLMTLNTVADNFGGCLLEIVGTRDVKGGCEPREVPDDGNAAFTGLELLG